MRLTRCARFFQGTLVALVTAAFGASVASAQGTITGRITATGTSEALGDARVLVVGTNAAAETDQNGNYRLTNVRSGNVDVQVLRVGYATQKKTVFVTAGGSQTIDFQMVVAVVKLQEMVTTATGQQRKVELGNALATIAAPKLAEEAPI